MTKISELSEYVTFLSRTRVQDQYGGVKDTWSESISCWARICPVARHLMTATDSEVRRKVIHTPSFRVRLRAETEITQTMKVKWRDTIYAMAHTPTIEKTRTWVDFIMIEVRRTQ